MNILRYEFLDSPASSYDGLVGHLVRNVRFGRNQVSIEEFKKMIPELQKLERQLQNLDTSVGESKRDYIKEIMTELDKESETENEIIKEIEWYSKTIIHSVLQKDFSLDEFLIVLKNQKATLWIEFYGYKEERETDLTLIIVKEICRSICIKMGVIFLDIMN